MVAARAGAIDLRGYFGWRAAHEARVNMSRRSALRLRSSCRRAGHRAIAMAKAPDGVAREGYRCRGKLHPQSSGHVIFLRSDECQDTPEVIRPAPLVRVGNAGIVHPKSHAPYPIADIGFY